MLRKTNIIIAMGAIVLLLLSGCSLIVKDEAVDNATVILKLGDARCVVPFTDLSNALSGPKSIRFRA